MHTLAAIPLAAVLALLGIQAQNPFGDLQSRPAKEKSAAVTYLYPEQVSIPAGKPSPVDLHFKVADGLHVNSHSPHAEELIPTDLRIPADAGVRLASSKYPAGTDYAFSINPAEKLSVYTGEFTIHTELEAPKGEHLVQATLHYQACNNSACMPPHSIPVVLDVIAK